MATNKGISRALVGLSRSNQKSPRTSPPLSHGIIKGLFRVKQKILEIYLEYSIKIISRHCTQLTLKDVLFLTPRKLGVLIWSHA